jgi:hypothetical protein
MVAVAVAVVVAVALTPLKEEGGAVVEVEAEFEGSAVDDEDPSFFEASRDEIMGLPLKQSEEGGGAVGEVEFEGSAEVEVLGLSFCDKIVEGGDKMAGLPDLISPISPLSVSAIVSCGWSG